MEPLDPSNMPSKPPMLDFTTLKITSSWGARIIEVKDFEGHVHSLKGSELIAALGQTIENSKSPEEIEKAKTILNEIIAKNMEAGNSNPFIWMLNGLGITNAYLELDEKLQKSTSQIPLLRDEHIQEMDSLIEELDRVSNQLKEVEILIKSESPLRKSSDIDAEGNFSTGISEMESIMLGFTVDKLKEKISEKQKILDSYPEFKTFKNEEKDIKNRVFKEYDELHNIKDEGMRLFGAEVAAKMAKGEKPTNREVNILEFLQAINKISKDILIEKQFDEGLTEQKKAFIDNLREGTPIKPLLENEELKKLANEVDDFMYGNPSMQELALFIGVTVPEKIKKGALAGKELIGKDEMTDAALALMLLQKNTNLPSSLWALHEHCIELANKEAGFSHQTIVSFLDSYSVALSTIERLNDIQSRLNEITLKLKSKSTIEVMDETNPLIIEFEKLKEEMRQLGSKG